MSVSICWFRQDLRLSDNRALIESAKYDKVLPIYILDPKELDYIGSANKCWLHYSLERLSLSLNGKLRFFFGDPLSVIKELLLEYNVSSINWGRCYEPWNIERDERVKKSLKDKVLVKSFNNSLLWEPWEVLKKDNTPYKVFTPFYKKGCLSLPMPAKPIPKPSKLHLFDEEMGVKIEDLKLLPSKNWYKTVISTWSIGEEHALELLHDFLETRSSNYKIDRDFPNLDASSKLSPYLHFGEISPRMVYHSARACGDNEGIDCYLKELIWREFSYYNLYHCPSIVKENINQKFDNFPWQSQDDLFRAWKKGLTGVPMVDAGMRQLWQTGYMHNRVRMLVASFLVKNLLVDWREGAKWFLDCLFDADHANNSLGWQWVSGCGIDAAPYFRIFNPVLQGEKFDSNGEYVRKYVPELKGLPNKYIHHPWDAPISILKDANIELGKNYPNPIVDIKLSRQVALGIFDALS